MDLAYQLNFSIGNTLSVSPKLSLIINYFRHSSYTRKHAYIFNQNSCPTFNQCMNTRKINYGTSRVSKLDAVLVWIG
jgi:hypothetical protein